MAGSDAIAMSTGSAEPAEIVGPAVIIIDGEIGAGKTTLIEHLRSYLAKQGLQVVVVPEPVDEWKRVGILQEFYADKPAELRGPAAYNFQTYTFVTRVEASIRAVETHPGADVFILERSILTDRFVFMELQRDLVGPMYMEMYDRWWSLWARVLPFRLAPGACKIVYLKPTLDNCQDRVATRAREGEVADADKTDEDASARGGVSGAYQARLRRAHEAYLQNLHCEEFPDMPPRPFAADDVVVVEGALADSDFSARGDAADRIASFIAEKTKVTSTS